VRVYRVKLGEGSEKHLTQPTLALPDRPSIAVLPFQDMSGDADQEYFADGMREIAPQLTVGSIRDFLSGFLAAEALAYQVDGLAKAGLPEE
jgi:hypothetical protein